MTTMPILLRELRAQGRSPATYWARCATAAVAVLLYSPFFLPGWLGASPALLSSAGFLLCCGACVITADAISRERREETLGLLLLTRVSHWDVLWGKFVCRGLASLAALLALSPLLAIPLLAGETTAGEAARTAAALVNTLFLALAAGACASSFGYHKIRTLGGALLLCVAAVIGPLFLGAHLSLASPLRTLKQATDAPYTLAPGKFWLSLGLVHAVAWGLLGCAVAGMRRTSGNLQGGLLDLSRPRTGPEPPREGAGTQTVRCRYCGRSNDSERIYCYECGTELVPAPVPSLDVPMASALSPLHWLLRRYRGAEPMLWVAAALMACQVAASHFGGRLIGFAGGGPPTWVFLWGSALLIQGIASALIASAASRFVVEARRHGTLELLMTTPLGAEQLVLVQWDLVKRAIRLPLLLMITPTILHALFTMLVAFPGQPGVWVLWFALSMGLRIAEILLGVYALCWVALWGAFRGMGQGRTIVWAVGAVTALPYLLAHAWSLGMFFLRPSSPVLMASALAQQTAILVYYAWLTRLARSRLLGNTLDPEPFDAGRELKGLLLQGARILERARRWPGK